MRRRALAAALAAAGLLACGRGAGPPRNVVLVSLDTLRADHLGLYGYERDTSPSLDALAREGVVFERAIAQAGATIPSHRALFQSRWASATRRSGLGLAEVLGRHGFRRVAFTGGGNLSARLGFGREFERYEEHPEGLAVIEPRVERWLRSEAASPFFLFVHTYDIHLPYDPPPPYDTLFDDGYRGSVTGVKTRDILRRIRGLRGSEGFTGSVELSEADRRRFVSLYDGGIRYADAWVGRFVALLGELGLLDTTILVVLSDHGEEFWDHGSVIHSHSVFEELVHVPLVWRLPGRRFAGTRVGATVRLIDVAPTLLDLLGLPVPEEFQGRSLLPLLSGREALPRPAISEQRRLKALAEHPWKLVRDGDGGELLLFDLERDPGERESRAAERPELAAALADRLDAALGGGARAEVNEIEEEGRDADLDEQLRALGYLD